MLTVTLKEDGWLHIGDDIKLQVKGIRGNQVVVGIEAPRDLKVLRGELVKLNQELSLPR